MKTQKVLSIASVSFIGFSAFAIGMVSLLAFYDPQRVMNLVQVKLPNTDAYSSIRGIYGGVGFTIFITFVYLALKDAFRGLVFAAMLWGSYALSRFITMLSEGALGSFGKQWFATEGALFTIALILISFHLRSKQLLNKKMA